MAPYYLQDIQVVISDDSHPPDDCIKELNYNKPDINAGFKGKYVWLVPKRTVESKNACTYIEIQITDHAIAGQSDLAAGAGGKYRYLKLYHDAMENSKVTSIALYRKPKSAGPVSPSEAAALGFNRISTDINSGRKGDWLHLIYKVEL